MNIRLASDPHLRRWMLFVDGENFTLRGQQYCRDNSFNLVAGDYWEENVFLWIPNFYATQAFGANQNLNLQESGIRSYYYTSVVGDDNRLKTIEDKLHTLGFSPHVFKKSRQELKAKGVDICLTKDLLSNAFMNNYDVAVIVTGDADFIPAIEEVKRLGKIVYICTFLASGFSERLALKSDMNIDIVGVFMERWNAFQSD